MFNKSQIQQTVLPLICLLLPVLSIAGLNEKSKSSSKGSQVQRVASGVFDQQTNGVSAVEINLTNYGIFGLDVARNRGGGFWPRGSQNQYIFGGGVWFAALKKPPLDDTLRKRCVISYNPNSGESWMAPGRIEDGLAINEDLKDKYRIYFSTDFSSGTGLPYKKIDGPNWPIWDTDNLKILKRLKYVGNYVHDDQTRNSASYPKGPAFISGEDIVNVFKDTDLSRYEIGINLAKSKGYPFNLQFEQTIYSWGFGAYKDFLFLRYTIIHDPRDKDTLYNCYLAPAMDMDIALKTNSQTGAGNDRASFFFDSAHYNLAYQYSGSDAGEAGKGFGYIGFDFLESPAVHNESNSPNNKEKWNFLRKDKAVYASDEQIGLTTFRNWVIDNDPKTDEERYDFVSAGIKEGDTGPGDKRFLTATGPFHMAPGDTARVVVGIIFASTPQGKDANGTTEDLANLIKRDLFAQIVYDNNFKAPRPPDRCFLDYKSLNNGTMIQWDETSENSVDSLEAGLDFVGYRLYRGRRTDLDTFAVESGERTGPFGWKQIATWSMPNPIQKTDLKLGTISENALVDSLRLLAPVSDSLVVLVFRDPSLIWQSFFRSLSPADQRKYLVDTVIISPTSTFPAPKILAFNPNTKADSLKAITQIYASLTSGQARLDFFDFEQTPEARAFIKKYMDSITNHRTFIDYGDDDGDGQITRNENLAMDEQIMNNVDYYYRMLAYDEGEAYQPTPIKLNDGVDNINVKQTYAIDAPGGVTAEVEIVSADKEKFGGFKNFKFTIVDPSKFYQLYGSDSTEIELEFQPRTFPTAFGPQSISSPTPPLYYGVYGHEITLRVKHPSTFLKTGGEWSAPIMTVDSSGYFSTYSPTQCRGGILYAFAENAILFVGDTLREVKNSDGTFDTVPKMAFPNSQLKLERSGQWFSDVVCNGPQRNLNGVLGFSFDYDLQQWGGEIRLKTPDSTDFVQGAVTKADSVVLPVLMTKMKLVRRIIPPFVFTSYESFNNGAQSYEMKFTDGATETIQVKVGADTGFRVFEVPFLNVELRNISSFEKSDITGKTETVNYNNALVEHEAQVVGQAPTNKKFPIPEDVTIGKFNLSAFGFVNIHNGDAFNVRRNQYSKPDEQPLGSQGRYYLRATSLNPKTNVVDTLDFVHAMEVNGGVWYFDPINKNGRGSAKFPGLDVRSTTPIWNGKNFKSGDIVRLSTEGGAVGLPLAGAKVKARVKVTKPDPSQYTNADLDEVKIVPNPYLISHAGQKSGFDLKLYITRLPRICTIKIYTIYGDLIRTIDHNEQTSSDRTKVGLDVWNLVSENRQRSASQELIAVVETPNGARKELPFSIVTGGFLKRTN